MAIWYRPSETTRLDQTTCGDRDNHFYLEWDEISRDQARTEAWLAEWVYGVADRAEYVRKLGPETLERLKPTPAPAGTIDYGSYR